MIKNWVFFPNDATMASLQFDKREIKFFPDD